MHNAWMRFVAGRLESRYRYSNTIVYNNFPFPFPARQPEDKIPKKEQAHRAAIEAAAQAVLDGREAERDRIRRINAARAAKPGFTPLPEPTTPSTTPWTKPTATPAKPPMPTASPSCSPAIRNLPARPEYTVFR